MSIIERQLQLSLIYNRHNGQWTMVLNYLAKKMLVYMY